MRWSQNRIPFIAIYTCQKFLIMPKNRPNTEAVKYFNQSNILATLPHTRTPPLGVSLTSWYFHNYQNYLTIYILTSFPLSPNQDKANPKILYSDHNITTTQPQ